MAILLPLIDRVNESLFAIGQLDRPDLPFIHSCTSIKSIGLSILCKYRPSLRHVSRAQSAGSSLGGSLL
jgi:hypothetical protein